MEQKYFDYTICAKCNGRCCKRCSGSYIPSDFNQVITKKFIKSLLKTEMYAIDWWEGDAKGGNLNQTYYLRPRHKNEPAICGSWGNECINFTDGIGCSLKEKDRPFQCRMLIPNVDGKCETLEIDKASKQECAIAWYEYQNILQEIVNKY
jgi:hypothetical protein